MSSFAELSISEQRMVWTEAYQSTTFYLLKGLLIVGLWLYAPLFLPTLWFDIQKMGVGLPVFCIAFGIVTMICLFLVSCRFRVSNPERYVYYLWSYIGIAAFGLSLLSTRWGVYHTLPLYAMFIMMNSIYGIFVSFDPESRNFARFFAILGACVTFIFCAMSLNYLPTYSIRSILYLSLLNLYIFDSIDRVLDGDRILYSNSPIIASVYSLLRPFTMFVPFFQSYEHVERD